MILLLMSFSMCQRSGLASFVIVVFATRHVTKGIAVQNSQRDDRLTDWFVLCLYYYDLITHIESISSQRVKSP